MGNKCDLAPSSTAAAGGEDNKRAVTVEEAEEWCRREGVMRYVETSAKSGEGVEGAFLEVAERIYENVVRGRYDLSDRRSGVRGPGGRGGQKGGGVDLGGASIGAAGRCC